jgi:hypothetical protein
MQFISNKICIGKSKSFEDICQEFLAKKNASVKTASVKVAEADEAPSSGQLAVEPLHQEGESTNQDSVAGGKNNEGSKDGGKAPAKKADEEGEDSGQPKAEGSEKFTNDPKVEANADASVKVAEAKCEECDCDPCSCKEAKKDEEDTDIEAKKDEEDGDEVKEAGVTGSCSKCDKPNFLCKCKGDSDSDSDDSDKEDKDDKKEDKEASATVGFKKIANLTSEEKTRLGKFWKNIYPDAFVEAMLADK